MKQKFVQHNLKQFISTLFLAFIILNQNTSAQTASEIKGATLTHAYLMGKTKPLRDLAPAAPTSPIKRKLKKQNKPGEDLPPNFIGYEGFQQVNRDALPAGDDPVRQKYLTGEKAFPIFPTVVIEGIDQETSQVGVPDTNGDVSPDHYIQIVNASYFQVFDKTGNALTAPTTANTIWNEIGFSSFSDPVIHYDADADRWFITDLANIDQVLYGVSETNDPLGSWFVYMYMSTGFADYPKYGIWPEAYIFSTNEGIGDNSPVFAINREQLLQGEPVVAIQTLNIPSIPNGGFPAVTPIGWSGTEPPATAAKPSFIRINDDAWGNTNQDRVEIWTMDIDWDNPANTTVDLLPINTAPFDSQPCAIGDMSGFGECIPQPAATGLDGIATVIMNKINYYNYGSHEGFAIAFTVDAGNDVAGIRWMEIRRDTFGNDWDLYQEGTFAPTDDLHRFIPAISLNSQGHLGLGYAVSSSTKFASLRYTGRRADDPLGEMTVNEYEFAEGLSAYTLSSRFGDYASMSVDPVDDSFWFTHEYMLADGFWGSKIVNYSLRRDTLDLAATALITPVNSPDLTDDESITAEFTNLGLDTAFNFSVGYRFENGTAVVEPATKDTLLPSEVYQHTFGPTVDMSTVGSYGFQVFSIFSADQFIRNDTLQQTVRKLPRFDAGITGSLGLEEAVCDSTAEVALAITNFGTETITTVKVNYRVNGEPLESFDYNTFLLPQNSVFATITLTGLPNGTNQIEAFTSLPNGTADEVPANDAFARDFQVILGGKQIFFSLSTDLFPNETTWQLVDDQGAIVRSGGPYNQPFTEFTEEWCLRDSACYEFTIMDTYGDGIQSFAGEGDYVIRDAEGNELASLLNANFGFSETHPFCVIDCSPITADFSISSESTSNANDGMILISPLSGNGPFQYSNDGGQTFQDSPIFEGLTAGEYDIVIIDAFSCETTATIIISTLVSNRELFQEYTMSVFPNPSENGVFKIELKGLEASFPYLQMQVMDALGRPVIYKKLARANGHYTGLLSLHAYPSGVYYVRFMDEGINEVVKVVRR